MSDLASDQSAAVNDPSNRIVVSAAPGSGKTRTIVARVKKMIADGVPKDSIAVVTFTRTAAKHLRDLIGQGPFIGTIHSLALDIIRRHGHESGWATDQIRILSEDEDEIEIRYLAESMGVKPTKTFFENIDGLSIGTKVASVGRYENEQKILEMHRSLLRGGSYVSMRTIIREAREIIGKLNEKPHIRNIILDESQDSSKDDIDMLAMLAELSFFAAGDLDQSIYGFRGSRPDLFLKMSKEDGFKLHRIGRTYRFGSLIAAPANALISHNRQRFDDAKIVTEEREGEEISYERGMTVEKMLEVITRGISRHGHGKVAVLARTHMVLSAVGKVLEKVHIPFVHVRPPSDITKTKEFRVLMATVRATCDPSDARARAVMDMAKIGSLNECRNLDQCMSVAATASGMDADKMKKAYVKLLKLQWEHGVLFDELPEHVGLGRAVDLATGLNNGVNLMTVHGAKGLEWPCVLVVGLNKNLWPSDKNMVGDGLEEERRLSYVACTRSQRELTMASLNAADFDLPFVFDGDSTFLNELQGITT